MKTEPYERSINNIARQHTRFTRGLINGLAAAAVLWCVLFWAAVGVRSCNYVRGVDARVSELIAGE